MVNFNIYRIYQNNITETHPPRGAVAHRGVGVCPLRNVEGTATPASQRLAISRCSRMEDGHDLHGAVLRGMADEHLATTLRGS